MNIAIYETYDYNAKSFFWWTQRDKAANYFEIRKSGNKCRLLINDNYDSEYADFNDAIKHMEAKYNNGDAPKAFHILRF